MDSKDNILEVRDLKVHFPIRKGVWGRCLGFVKALDGVTFDLRRGETLGLIGASGSGKSTLARVLMGLERPTSGRFEVKGRSAMVFQDPLGALNPRQTIRAALEETLRFHDQEYSEAAIIKLLEEVGLGEEALDRYPHAFSGGERQRICIARALAAHPDVLICDEAVSALDLSIRAQVLDLLKALKARFNLSLLFITHDLGVVQHIADRLIVMKTGRLTTDCATLQELLAAVPRLP